MRATLEPISLAITDFTSENTPIYNENTIDGNIFVGDISALPIETVGVVVPVGASQVIEPEIINTVPNQGAIQPTLTLEQVQEAVNQPSGGVTTTIQEPNVLIPSTKPETLAEPSATTDETKTYGGGGTTPNSTIVIKKPKPNYLVYGIVGVIGVLVVYKVFFKGKTQ